jgi:hypothetical protein
MQDFSSKFSLERHKQKKNTCLSYNDDNVKKFTQVHQDFFFSVLHKIEEKYLADKTKHIELVKNQCKWCLKIMNSPVYLNKHINELNCFNYKEFITYKRLLREIVSEYKIEEEVKKVDELISYEEEDINKLTDEEMGEILYKGHKYNELILKYLYLNPRLPENHNILLEVVNNKLMIKYYKKDKWNIKEYNKFVMKIINNNKKKLSQIMDKKDELEPATD